MNCMQHLKFDTFLLIFILLFNVSSFAIAPSLNGYFWYTPHDEICLSGPGTPADLTMDLNIAIVDERIKGICNGFDGTPRWSSPECCLQVCETYDSPSAHCELKQEYKQLLEAKLGDLDEYRVKKQAELEEQRLQEELRKQQKETQKQTSLAIVSALVLIVVGLAVYSRYKK